MADYGMNITADSLPDYDGFGWDKYWTCTDWMIWYSRLKDAHGAAEARLTWKTHWEQQDSTASPYMWCLYSDDFYAFIKENELGLKNNIADITSSGGKAITGLFKGFGWIGQNIIWIAPTILIIGGAAYGYKYYKLLK